MLDLFISWVPKKKKKNWVERSSFALGHAILFSVSFPPPHPFALKIVDWSPFFMVTLIGKVIFWSIKCCVFPMVLSLNDPLQNHRLYPVFWRCLQKTPQCLFDVCCTPIKALRLSAGSMWSEHSPEKSSESVWITCMMCVCAHILSYINIIFII